MEEALLVSPTQCLLCRGAPGCICQRDPTLHSDLLEINITLDHLALLLGVWHKCVCERAQTMCELECVSVTMNMSEHV